VRRHEQVEDVQRQRRVEQHQLLPGQGCGGLQDLEEADPRQPEKQDAGAEAGDRERVRPRQVGQ